MNCRSLEIPATPVSDASVVVILQESQSQTGGIIWDAALVLEAFIRKTAKEASFLFDGQYLPKLENSTLVDLGTGTGFIGLSFLPYRLKSIILTDLQDQLKLPERNIDLNQKVLQNLKKSTSLETRALDWTNPGHISSLLEAHPQIDIITASDIVFIPSIAQQLIECLKGIMKANKHCFLLLSLAYRTPDDKEFIVLLEQSGFVLNCVKRDMMDEVIQSDDIDIFIIRFKQ